MVSRLIAGCNNLNESGIKCPEIMAAVINSAGYYKWPHNYYGDVSSTTFPRINEDYFTYSPNKTLLLWGENDNVIKPKSQLSDFYKKLNNGNIVVSHKKCGVCGHQWLPYVADNDFVTWLLT